MSDPMNKRIGRRLKEKREEFGLLQQELADELGYGRTSITNIEAGRQQLSLADAIYLGDYIGSRWFEGLF